MKTKSAKTIDYNSNLLPIERYVALQKESGKKINQRLYNILISKKLK